MPTQDPNDTIRQGATNSVDAGRERGQQAIRLGSQYQGPFPLWGCLSPIEQERIRHAVGTYVVDLITRAGGSPGALINALHPDNRFGPPVRVDDPQTKWPESMQRSNESMQHSSREAQDIAAEKKRLGDLIEQQATAHEDRRRQAEEQRVAGMVVDQMADPSVALQFIANLTSTAAGTELLRKRLGIHYDQVRPVDPKMYGSIDDPSVRRVPRGAEVSFGAKTAQEQMT